jgi:D-alanyl-D-alanine carboxypeptidase
LNGIPGVSIAVMRRGELAYTQAYGTRDAPGVEDDDNCPVLLSTPFRIMSISKILTATTVVLLAHDDRLGIDDVVFGEGGVLHSMTMGHADPMDPMIDSITVRQLLGKFIVTLLFPFYTNSMISLI